MNIWCNSRNWVFLYEMLVKYECAVSLVERARHTRSSRSSKCKAYTAWSTEACSPVRKKLARTPSGCSACEGANSSSVCWPKSIELSMAVPSRCRVVVVLDAEVAGSSWSVNKRQAKCQQVIAHATSQVPSADPYIIPYVNTAVKWYNYMRYIKLWDIWL